MVIIGVVVIYKEKQVENSLTYFHNMCVSIMLLCLFPQVINKLVKIEYVQPMSYSQKVFIP